MHGKNRKYSATGGRKARRERALERLRNTKFTPKTIKGKERNEKNWTKKKDAQIEVLESRTRIS